VPRIDHARIVLRIERQGLLEGSLRPVPLASFCIDSAEPESITALDLLDARDEIENLLPFRFVAAKYHARPTAMRSQLPLSASCQAPSRSTVATSRAFFPRI
jgi:hypothetical protein